MASGDSTGPDPIERPGNLPIQLSSFVGRASELAELQQLLGQSRLVTLIGSAGSGKTRLALQLASGLQSEYCDGAWFVELAAIADPMRVPQAVATVLGVQEEVGRTLLDTLVDHQRWRSSLLLLDNCEHLLEACAALVLTLLGGSPALKVLATSREALHLPGEAAWPVPSLTLPPMVEGANLADSLGSDAVDLFAERAALIKPSFRLTDRTAPIVARICRRLDGMPLAIELATARLRVLSVAEVDERLEDRFRLLIGGSPTAVQRQQTLRAAVDWSYSLLGQQDRLLFDRLAIFAGGFTLKSAEATCAGDGIAAEGVLDGLDRLAERSMLVADDAPDGNTRYRLLETMREYGVEQLQSSGAYEQLRSAHAGHFLEMAVTSQSHLTGPNQTVWLKRLEQELDNLRAALHWWQVQDPDQGLQMAAALAMFWYMAGHLTEGRQQLEAALKAARGSVRRAAGLYGLGLLEHRHAEYERACLHFDTAQSLFREAGDERGVGRSLMRSGKAAFELGDVQMAVPQLQEALDRLTAVDDRWGVAQTLHDLGVVYGDHGLRDHDRAIPYFREALAMRRELGDRHATAFTLFAFAAEPGPLTDRKALLNEALQIFLDMGDRVGMVVALESFASLASVSGDPRRAVKLLATAATHRERVGGASPRNLRLRVEELVGAARIRLSNTEAAELEAEGRSLPLSEAIALATQGWDPAEEVGIHRQQRVGWQLSRREVEVARLVSEGLTNRQIADRLFISHRTAEYHVEQIRNKLGFHSRSQVAAWSVSTLGISDNDRPSSGQQHKNR